MSISIYTLTSDLHDEQSVDSTTQAFLATLGHDYSLRGADYSDYGTAPLSLIFVRTGGTEGRFRELLPQLLQQSDQPFCLLTSGTNNSLAASMEILSYLRAKGYKGEILHGDGPYIQHRIEVLQRVEQARRRLRNCRLGIIGKPSDWLIASGYDPVKIFSSLGVTLVDIPMAELLSVYHALPMEGEVVGTDHTDREALLQSLPGANHIYRALKHLVADYQLDGLTLRCFDLLTSIRNTGCMALARLNGEGIVAGCEGDVPTMLTMMVSTALFGVSGFQANLSTLDITTGELLFAHCTIPLNMVERYELDTHFESGIGVGIRGYMEPGPVTIFKIAGDMSRVFIAEGQLLTTTHKENLCRTQQLIRLDDPAQARYFLTEPIGTHHVIIPGYVSDTLSLLIGRQIMV
ncbi:MAG: hypothetical protein J6Z18_04240 [Prevotella sp.]|nr:hypothetical protein [Prevotella sp.]